MDCIISKHDIISNEIIGIIGTHRGLHKSDSKLRRKFITLTAFDKSTVHLLLREFIFVNFHLLLFGSYEPPE